MKNTFRLVLLLICLVQPFGFAEQSEKAPDLREHTLNAILPTGIIERTVEIENGAGFVVRPIDNPKLWSWRTGDVLFIYSQYIWWNTCNLRIVNRTTNQEVWAYFQNKPAESSPHNYHILKRDSHNVIALVAQSGDSPLVYRHGSQKYFSLDPKESSALHSQWAPGDNVIILGSDDTTDGYEYTLLNASKEQMSRARKLTPKNH